MIQVNFPYGSKEATSSALYQWDYGQKLQIYGTELNDVTIQVHFCDKSCDRTIVRIASLLDATTSNPYYVVSIPDSLLENDWDIHAFIYKVDIEAGNTTHRIKIPIFKRKKPEGFISEPDPSQTTLLEETLIEINEVVGSLVEPVSKNTKDIETNKQAIATNTENITLNTTNIATNTKDIETLKTRLTKKTGNTITEIGLYSVTGYSQDTIEYLHEVMYLKELDVSLVGNFFWFNQTRKVFEPRSDYDHYDRITVVKLMG